MLSTQERYLTSKQSRLKGVHEEDFRKKKSLIN
jgi:hypothetical protein